MRPPLNERTLTRTIFLLGAFLALTSPPPLPAHAEPPAPNALMRLDDRLMRARRVRITTPSGWLVAKGVRVSVEGLVCHDVLTTTGGEPLPLPRRIPWEDVLRVDVPSNHALGAALVSGLVVAGIAYAGLYAAGQQGNDIGGGGAVLYAIPVVTLVGAGVGALIPAWHPIHRKPRVPTGRR
jgi:hypothetical protein